MDAIAKDLGHPTRAAELISSLEAALAHIQDAATGIDSDDAFPADEVRFLGHIGALVAPLPRSQGGLGLGTEAEGAGDLLALLLRLGRGNLALGRVYEGHVNAIRLIARHGDPDQLGRAASDTRAGHLFALWNTEPADDPVVLSGRTDRLCIGGSKILASAAGHATRPLLTATQPGDADRMLVLLNLMPGERADLSSWTAQGMRASATGRIRLDGLPLTSKQVIGRPDDYLKQPDFAAGAWRTSAVTLGGLDALMALYRRHLAAAGRGRNASQRAPGSGTP